MTNYERLFGSPGGWAAMSEIIPDVQDIVAAYLTEHGYDGLCDGEYGCACDMTCLMYCDGQCDDCEAGTKSDCKTCAKNGICDRQIDEETDWMMFPGHGVCGGYEPVVPDA